MLYLASPFFNEKENAALDVVECALDRNEITYFSPRKAAGNEPSIPKEEKLKKAREIFEKDIWHMKDADILLAATDGYPFIHEGRQGIARDAGTSFELGYFYSKMEGFGSSNIVTFSASGFGSNLMIAQASKLHLHNMQEVCQFLDFAGSLKPHNETFVQGMAFWFRVIEAYKAEFKAEGMTPDVEKP